MTVAVLIVDDEPALNELFVIGLTKYGYQTKGVLGGRECLDILENLFRPDLILLDMMMEPMDGWETLIRIKNNDKIKDIPVILQTGKNLTYKEAERFVNYIEDYIMKPITPKRCLEHIDATINKVTRINNIINRGISKGYEEDTIRRFAELYRMTIVAKRLLEILQDRYGHDKPDSTSESYGPEEYNQFLINLQKDYNLLKDEMTISIGDPENIIN